MTDLKNRQERGRVKALGTVTAAQAVDLNVDAYDCFTITAADDAGAPALTWLGVTAGQPYWVTFVITTTGTTDWLKPTNATSTNSAGTTLVFHTNGTGGTGAAWPTLSTTQGLVDLFQWFSPDGVNFYLVGGASSVGLDE